MWSAVFSGVLKARLAVRVIDMMLPSGPELQRRCRAGLLGVMAAVAGGVLLAAAVMSALVGLGLFLHYETGYSMGAAVGIVALLTLALCLALFLIGRAKLVAALECRGGSAAPPAVQDDPFRDMLHGFVEGFVTSGPAAVKASPAGKKPDSKATDKKTYNKAV